MKKEKIVTSFFILGMLVVFNSCNSKLNYDEIFAAPSSYTTKENMALNELVLASSLDHNNKILCYSNDDWKSFLKNKYFKNLSNNKEKNIDEIISLIKSKKEELELPDFEIFSEESIKRIMHDFPTLSKDKVIEKRYSLQKIYENKLSSELCKELEIEDMEVSKYQFGSETLVGAEIAAVLAHPLSAVKLNDMKNIAYLLTQNWMGYNHEEVNTKIDAFRHCMLCFVLAYEGVGDANEKLKWATDFSMAHESDAHYRAYESEMDIHNNWVGLTLFVQYGYNGYGYDTVCPIIKEKAVSACFIPYIVNGSYVNFSGYTSSINAIDYSRLVYIFYDDKRY